MVKVFVILMAMASVSTMAATIEVHIPKGAKEAYALEGAAFYCGLYGKMTFEQKAEVEAMGEHYKKAREDIGLPYNSNLAFQASKDVFGIETIPAPTWSKCSKALKKGGDNAS